MLPPLRMITLKSSDGPTFEVEDAVAFKSLTIKDMIGENDHISLPNINSHILARVIEYCQKHVHEVNKDVLMQWDAEFVKNMDQQTLFDIIVAANYLDIKSLLDLTSDTVASMIKGKLPQQIRETFNIKNEFTPEEEEEIRRQNQWAFD